MSDLDRDQEAWARLDPRIQRFDRWAKGMPGDDLDGPESFSRPSTPSGCEEIGGDDEYDDEAEIRRLEERRHYE